MAEVYISEFTKKVIHLIRSVPQGKVATYKQIAELAGKPQGSRGVAWILHSCSTAHKLPWHRIINSQGKISFDPQSSNYRQQKRRLISEGVTVSQQGSLDLEKHRWKKSPPKKKGQHPSMFR